MITQGTAQAELKKLSDETGMFDSIPDEDIEKNKDKTFQDVTALQDPMAGLTGSKEDNPFTKDELTVDFNPYHGPDGRFCSGNNNLTYEQTRSKLTINKVRVSNGWSKANLDKHFGSKTRHDHQKEYPGWNQEEYGKWAIDLLENQVDGVALLGFETPDVIYRYFKPTNDFVIEGKKTKVITMFRPDDGISYYEGEREKR